METKTKDQIIDDINQFFEDNYSREKKREGYFDDYDFNVLRPIKDKRISKHDYEWTLDDPLTKARRLEVLYDEIKKD